MLDFQQRILFDYKISRHKSEVFSSINPEGPIKKVYRKGLTSSPIQGTPTQILQKRRPKIYMQDSTI